ncbi:hypothetical protein [Nonomuraea sp. NPDC049784]|uniref:hypothetical protein n=1 Tax=Nonomuraea sp. NPDC049784 TaxID=3154361 RepID=UPI0033EE33B8
MTVNTPEGEDPSIVSEEVGRWFPYATVQGDSFAYLSIRPTGEGRDEFGATATARAAATSPRPS